MFLSTTNKLLDGKGDYAVIIDYGSEGLSVLSQYYSLIEAMMARDACDYGEPMAIVKICRIEVSLESV